MTIPSQSEITALGSTFGPPLPEEECETFFDYFESNGWRVGRVPMKKWAPALKNWWKRWKQRNPEAKKTTFWQNNRTVEITRDRIKEIRDQASWTAMGPILSKSEKAELTMLKKRMKLAQDKALDN